MFIVVPSGAFALYKIVNYFSGDNAVTSSGNVKSKSGYTSEMKYPKLMDAVLSGEASGYNDHNYYNPSLRGYVQGKWGNKYSLLTKNLVDYTISEILSFQSNSRNTSAGQLWAVGRYQIIPTTLRATYPSAGLKLTDKFSPSNQDKLGMALLRKRPKTWSYLTKKTNDTATSLNAAALDLAMEWSSIGVPYSLLGHWKVNVAKNESYYKPQDRATTPTEKIQNALKESRNA